MEKDLIGYTHYVPFVKCENSEGYPIVNLEFNEKSLLILNIKFNEKVNHDDYVDIHIDYSSV